MTFDPQNSAKAYHFTPFKAPYCHIKPNTTSGCLTTLEVDENNPPSTIGGWSSLWWSSFLLYLQLGSWFCCWFFGRWILFRFFLGWGWVGFDEKQRWMFWKFTFVFCFKLVEWQDFICSSNILSWITVRPWMTIEVGLALGIGLSFILLLLIILSLVPRHRKGWRWKGWSQAVDVYWQSLGVASSQQGSSMWLGSGKQKMVPGWRWGVVAPGFMVATWGKESFLHTCEGNVVGTILNVWLSFSF